ncbi:MAG: permease-like cell division protein FtsX [Bacteroidales bacterium]|nr:permease-like cell division protein FtsX [Bacteroidales bacterium]
MAVKEKTVKRRLAGAYVSSALSIALVLLLVGLAALLSVNARGITRWFKENMQMEVLLHEEVSEPAAEGYKAGLEALPYVKSVRMVTREEGLKELREMLGEDFLDVFESTSVPLSLELTLKADYVNADSLAMVSESIKASSLVDEVETQVPLVDSLNANLSRISLILGVFILLLLFISFVLIGNTVRLGIYARRFTVHTMQLVGASRAFIRRPFMRDSFVLGLVSSLLTIAVLGGGIWFAQKSVPQLAGLFAPEGLAIVAGIILLVGIGICLLTTWSVVGHLVVMDKDKLYY